MTRRWRKFLTYLMMAAFMAPITAPLVDKIAGGDGRFVYFHAELVSADDILRPQHQQVYNYSDGDVLDLDNDEQTPQDDHFNVMTMAFTASYDLVIDIPEVSYSLVPTFEPLSHISSPLVRPPRLLG